MSLPSIVVPVACLLLTGCGSTVRVYKSNSLSSDPKGIPFYAKTAVCKQETVWLEPQYVLSYEQKIGKDAFGPIEKVLSRREFLDKTVQGFILQPGDLDAWSTKIVTLPGPSAVNESDAASILAEEKLGNWTRVANSATLDAVVDYSIVFYLNSKRPLAGTGQIDGKLAADGTLTEGSAQIQDQTLATVASAISSLTGSASTAAKIVGLDTSSDFKLTVKTRFYKHIHDQYAAGLGLAPDKCTPASAGVFGGWFSVSEATDSAGSKPSGTDKENTITLNGSIVLPKSAAPTPGTPSPTTPPPAVKKQP
ncbi:MAG TPA: hypothetical protein VMT28_13025 [Terriglobales bacterium]|nr:hypothetical protein [Terriglobales bacterium]